MRTKATTLKDVARLAGASETAVSAVVRGAKSTVGVSEATRLRIQQALEELHYQPNRVARSLRQNKTETIGFYNGYGHVEAKDPFIKLLFHGLHLAAGRHAHDLLLYYGLVGKPLSVVTSRLTSYKADGVVALPSPGDGLLLENLAPQDKPVICIVDEHPGITSVTADDAGGSRLLARHFVSRGHRTILYRRSLERRASETTRFEAFRAEAEQAGAQVIATSPTDGFDTVAAEEEALLLSKERRITAAACWHDGSAVALLKFCIAHGLRVPEDMAIVGFDGDTERDWPPGYQLTTVRANWYEVASTGVALLLAKIAGEEVPLLTVIPSELLPGNTT